MIWQAHLRLLAGPALLLALGACSGPAAPGGGGDTSWATANVTADFDSGDAATILASAEFQNVDADCVFYGCGSAGAPGVNQPNAYALINLHEALSTGLTGAGETIAIMDNGFRLTHDEFVGKTITTYGTIPLEDHGTHVAAIAAANRDASEMHGVAPGAALHLTSFDPLGAGFDIAHVTAGTLNAKNAGAIVQNNSWGFEVSAASFASYLSGHPGVSNAAALNATLGHGTANWANYIAALNSFQNTGVVVFALSNDDTMTSGDVLASLPAFETSLGEAWLTAVNGYFEVNGSGAITDAVLISARCGYSASFCLAGDGTTYAAEGASNSDFDTGTGTSFVAPQISGAVALLAEAFPSLTPAEWADRLLASADNSWFTAQGVATSGTTTFSGGISHAYSNTWGHGVLDVAAALKPIGGVSVHSGPSIAADPGTPIAGAGLAVPRQFGDGLSIALRGHSTAVFDALGADFKMDAGNLVQTASRGLGRGLMNEISFKQSGGTSQTSNDLLAMSGTTIDDWQIGFTAATNLSAIASPLSGVTTQKDGFLAIAGTGAHAEVSGDLFNGKLQLTAFSAEQTSAEDAAMSGVGANFSFSAGATDFGLGFKQIAENGAFLGLAGNQAFALGTGSTVSLIDLAISHALSPNLSIYGGAEYGRATPTGFSGDGLVKDIGAVGFSGFELGTTFHGVATKDDSLTVSLAQPMRIEQGTADLSLASGRTKNGTILYQDLSAALVPTGREVDFGLTYDIRFANQGRARFGAIYAFDMGHVAGAKGLALAAAYANGF